MRSRQAASLSAIALSAVVVASCAAPQAHIPPKPAGYIAPAAMTKKSTTSDCAAKENTEQPLDPSMPPNAVALNCLVQYAINPSVPESKKLELIDGRVGPQLFKTLVALKRENPNVEFGVVNPVIKTSPTTATANFQITLNGQAYKRPAQIVFSQGRWRLQKSTVCDVAKLASYDVQGC